MPIGKNHGKVMALVSCSNKFTCKHSYGILASSIPYEIIYTLGCPKCGGTVTVSTSQNFSDRIKEKSTKKALGAVAC